MLAIVVSSSQHADGASWSLIMPIAQAARLACTVFALAIRRGVGGVSTGEALLIGLAAAGVPAGRWRRSHFSPLRASWAPISSASA